MPAGSHHDDHRTWDEWYAQDGDGRLRWSGQPNGVLVAEAGGLTPGTALDVGCGEGADAIWLAQRGWRVTALDPSGVALERAQAAARAGGVEVAWVHAGLLEVPGGIGAYDLVTAHYAVLRRSDGHAPTSALLEAVAPGGTLLVVHHAGLPARAADHGHDGADYVGPGDVAERLDHTWKIEVHETRPRPEVGSPQNRHTGDVVLRARRLTEASSADTAGRRQ